MTKYAVSCSGSYEIEEVSAKTLRSAKMMASRMFGQSVNGKIKVHEVVTDGNGKDYPEVAIKYGYDKNWTNC